MVNDLPNEDFEALAQPVPQPEREATTEPGMLRVFAKSTRDIVTRPTARDKHGWIRFHHESVIAENLLKAADRLDAAAADLARVEQERDEALRHETEVALKAMDSVAKLGFAKAAAEQRARDAEEALDTAADFFEAIVDRATDPEWGDDVKRLRYCKNLASDARALLAAQARPAEQREGDGG